MYLVFELNQTFNFDVMYGNQYGYCVRLVGNPYRRVTISYMMFGMATCHDPDLPDSQRFMTD